jgi:multidrug resistance efflux pump
MRKYLVLFIPAFAVLLACIPAWTTLTAQTTSKPPPRSTQKTAQKTSRTALESQNEGDGKSKLFGSVMAIDDVPVPAQESGPISKVTIKIGDAVTEDQLLVEMDTATAKLEVEAATSALEAALAKANDPSEIEYAMASVDLAMSELDGKLGINKERKGVIPESEIRKLRFAKTKADKGVTAAQTAQEIARKSALVEKAKVAVAEHKLKRLQILSPLNGVVSDVTAQKGAWVMAGDPVATVTRMDQLRIDIRLDSTEYNPSDLIGRKMTIILPLADNETIEFPGKITVVSPNAQRSSYFAKCDIENRQENGQWLLRPGLSVEARLAPR